MASDISVFRHRGSCGFGRYGHCFEQLFTSPCLCSDSSSLEESDTSSASEDFVDSTVPEPLSVAAAAQDPDPQKVSHPLSGKAAVELRLADRMNILQRGTDNSASFPIFFLAAATAVSELTVKSPSSEKVDQITAEISKLKVDGESKKDKKKKHRHRHKQKGTEMSVQK